MGKCQVNLSYALMVPSIGRVDTEFQRRGNPKALGSTDLPGTTARGVSDLRGLAPVTLGDSPL